MKLPAKTNFFCLEYFLMLNADDSPDKLKIHENREAFFAAVLHYAGAALWQQYLDREAEASTKGLFLDLENLTFRKYIQDMYKGGRWTEAEGENAPRTIDIIRPEGM